MDELTVLKGQAYDCIAQMEYLRGQLSTINTRIATLAESVKKKKPVKDLSVESPDKPEDAKPA